MNGARLRGGSVLGLAVVLMASIVAGCVDPSTSPAVSPTRSPSTSSASPTAGGSQPTPSASASVGSSTGLPDFPHVWIVVFENRDYDRVVTRDDLPGFRDLIQRFGLAEESYGVAQPSQPNYLAMFSGSTHGVTSNGSHDIDAPTVADQIEASGRTWREYAENRPPDCFEGSEAVGGRDGPGEYRRKHAPAISFDSIRTNPTRCEYLVDLTAFRPGDVDFALIVPNQCNSAHDCPLKDADAWLAGFIPTILDSDAFKAGGLLIVTFDEDGGDDPSGGHIATIVASPEVPAGFRSTERHDHYSLLRTIQDAWGLDCLAESCSAGSMDEFFASR